MATHSSIPVWKIPLQRSLAGYSPGGRKESVTIEHARAHECTKIHRIVYFKMVSFMLCEFYLNLKIAKKKEEEKERSRNFSLITIRTQVETGLVRVNGSQMQTWTAPSPPSR